MKAALRLPRERRIADLMRASREVFSEKGYEGAAISEIAERAGVVEGSIYRYFENKRALLVKVVEDWYEDLLTNFDRDLEGIHGTRNRLRFMIWRHLATIEREPAMCRLVFGVLRAGDDYRNTTVFNLNREYTRRTIAVVREGVAAGEVRDDVPMGIVRDLIYGCVEHHTWAYLRGEGTFSADDSADAITSVVWAGIATPAQRAPEVVLSAAVQRLEAVASRLEGTSAPARRRAAR